MLMLINTLRKLLKTIEMEEERLAAKSFTVCFVCKVREAKAKQHLSFLKLV